VIFAGASVTLAASRAEAAGPLGKPLTHPRPVGEQVGVDARMGIGDAQTRRGIAYVRPWDELTKSTQETNQS